MTQFSYPPDPEWMPAGAAEQSADGGSSAFETVEGGDAGGSSESGPPRRPYRPPIGVPIEKPSRWAAPLSILMHGLIIGALIFPWAAREILFKEPEPGPGAAGPAGGGGGGHRGSGGGEHQEERLHYTVPAAPPPMPAPAITPPVVPPPKPEEKKEEPPVPQIDVKIDLPKSNVDMSVTAGVGGGTGNDNSGGTGPGSGGGVGSGVGTGRGNNNGPGTGGGGGSIYAPVPDFVIIPPMPAPNKVKGKEVTVLFSVDERGKIEKIELANSSGDGGYDRRIREQFINYRFRPATRWDGTPVAFPRFPIKIQL